MKEIFKSKRCRSLCFEVPEYLATLSDYFDKAVNTITLDGFAKYLGVTKITEIKRFEKEVFIFYEDFTEDFETYYRVDEKFMLEDAYRALSSYFGGDDGYKALDDCERREFMSKFGFDIDDLFNEESDRYILGKMTNYFADQQDCNIPENNTWESVICQVISEL